MSDRRSPGGRRRDVAASFAVLATFAMVACDTDSKVRPPTTTEPAAPDAEAYGAALATVLDETDEPDEDRTVVYLVPFDEAIGIETQAAVIDKFAESYDIRFVDELAAAVDESEPMRPPRDDGMVIGVGAITTDPPHRVRLERYRSADDVRAMRLTLEFRDESWHVTTTEPVPAEVLIDAL